MLALGVPVVANAGVGDVERILSMSNAGAVVSGFDPASLRRAAVEALELAGQRERIRDEARRWFLLQDGVARYDSIYRSIARLHRRGEAPACRRRASGPFTDQADMVPYWLLFSYIAAGAPTGDIATHCSQ